MRVGVIRPGNSRTIARGCGSTITTLTSGSSDWLLAEATAEGGSLQPTRSGATTASINKMPADGA
jgi:hypothetical protein